MSEVTVSQLASDVGTSVDRLLKQLSDAGISKQNAEDVITEQEKVDLLNHLRRSHGKQEAAGRWGKAQGRPEAQDHHRVASAGIRSNHGTDARRARG